MNQADPLELVAEGSLARPGPVGRLVRLALGALCLFAVWDLLQGAGITISKPYSSLGSFALLVIFPICVFNYVVNIGFSKSWGMKPLIVSFAFLCGSAGIAYLLAGNFDSPLFGVPLLVFFLYFYAHLGVSFVLSAIISTPGCEMRAIPELWGRATGKPREEHNCPAAFITKIDEWERNRTA